MIITNDVKKIIDLLIKNNFDAYIVGGCVRDNILKKIPKDYDITTLECFESAFEESR